MTKGKDIRDVLEGYTTEGGGSSRGRGRLFGVVFIIDSVEMDRLDRDFSVPEQNFGVCVCHVRRNSSLRPCPAEPILGRYSCEGKADKGEGRGGEGEEWGRGRRRPKFKTNQNAGARYFHFHLSLSCHSTRGKRPLETRDVTVTLRSHSFSVHFSIIIPCTIHTVPYLTIIPAPTNGAVSYTVSTTS